MHMQEVTRLVVACDSIVSAAQGSVHVLHLLMCHFCVKNCFISMSLLNLHLLETITRAVNAAAALGLVFSSVFLTCFSLMN